ncbi:MAG: ATP-dependent 6-phosphofructokinase [Candidatus Omnitrophica bacterium]|nr:ATP-dependent 6-phosphofructokinase [Candidatus Omnitrophota bacterium]MBU4148973.1 ATP-dependent 6-phosphofructokinase [Candidatus Omnitrophota bacterium]
MQGSKKRIGVLTGGGDCPGLNAAIRAVTKTAMLNYGMEVVGIKDGFVGLIENKYVILSYEDVSGILTDGGTFLGASNKANPFKYADVSGRTKDVSDLLISNVRMLKLDSLVCIGGDGTLTVAYRLYKRGLRIVGVPKTIDNDLMATDTTIGFDSAVITATEAIDKLHTTAQSHHRVMVIEVMGRYAGWLALCSGVAGGGDIIIIPEIPYDIKKVCQIVKERHKRGKRFSIVVISEGARPRGGKIVIKKIIKDSAEPVRLGGIGNKIADDIEAITGLETRVTVLGHLQRGGTPSPFDRMLATRLGTFSCDLAAKGEFGKMAALRGRDIVAVSLKDAVKHNRLVNPRDSMITAAKAVGTSFGV